MGMSSHSHPEIYIPPLIRQPTLHLPRWSKARVKDGHSTSGMPLLLPSRGHTLAATTLFSFIVEFFFSIRPLPSVWSEALPFPHPFSSCCIIYARLFRAELKNVTTGLFPLQLTPIWLPSLSLSSRLQTAFCCQILWCFSKLSSSSQWPITVDLLWLTALHPSLSFSSVAFTSRTEVCCCLPLSSADSSFLPWVGCS